jgi:hypothetical protein
MLRIESTIARGIANKARGDEAVRRCQLPQTESRSRFRYFREIRT